MSNEKTLIEKLKIVLGLVEHDEMIEDKTEDVIEVVTPEVIEDVIEEVIKEDEKVENEVTPEEKTDIITEVMQILEPRIKALEEAILMMGENYKKENEELKSQVQKLSAEPAGVPVKPTFNLPSEENALANIVRNKRKK
jgi:hypothetical protein